MTLVFGGWDSSRRSRQGRWRSALVGEIMGFVSASRDQTGALLEPRAGLRGGARVDPVGMQINLNKKVMTETATRQQAELSPATYNDIIKAANGIKPGEAKSASALGLGGIPPTLEQLAGVACDTIIRTHVLSFATLRQMRFGAGVEGDAACRALLAALALNALARADAELYLRANCDLVEAEPTKVRLDQRGGAFADVEPLSIDAADLLLSEALAHAEKVADVKWSGLVMRVTGNPGHRLRRGRGRRVNFAIVAEPLLGVYKGHIGSGQQDPLPSPARLHAALLCAAAQGVRAVADGDGPGVVVHGG